MRASFIKTYIYNIHVSKYNIFVYCPATFWPWGRLTHGAYDQV